MIFEALKGTVEQLINNYECPDCQARILEGDVNIIGAAGTSINMEVCCSECNNKEYIEAQVFSLDLSKIIQKKVNYEGLKNKLENIDGYKSKISDVKSLLDDKKNYNNQINDNEIVGINRILKSKNFSLNDLFGK